MDSGPQNGVVGDQDLPTSLPESGVAEQDLSDEKKMAKYSKSTEYQRLKKFLEDRVKFYQRYYPSGQRVQDIPVDERGAYWQAACIVVTELEGVLDAYEQAREAVEDSAGRQDT